MKLLASFAFILTSQICLGLPSSRNSLLNNIEDKFEAFWWRLVNNGWCASKKGCYRKSAYKRIMVEIEKNDFNLQLKSIDMKNSVTEMHSVPKVTGVF